MSWQEITSQAEADAFMAHVGDFHDGCLREAHVWTEHWVGNDLAMAIGSDFDTSVRLLLQRQFAPLSAVELLFAQVTRFHLAPSPPNYDAIIHASTLVVRGPDISWADVEGWAPDRADSDDVTWVSARRLRWRDASEWMGPELRYGPGEPYPPAP